MFYAPAISQENLPSLETELGWFNVVYTSIDLTAFDLRFDPQSNRLLINGYDGHSITTHKMELQYVGIIVVKAASEEFSITGVNKQPPRLFILYHDPEWACLSAVNVPWPAAKLLLPSSEYAPMAQALSDARRREEQERIA